jgi:hypothetical protein
MEYEVTPGAGREIDRHVMDGRRGRVATLPWNWAPVREPLVVIGWCCSMERCNLPGNNQVRGQVMKGRTHNNNGRMKERQAHEKQGDGERE